MSIEFFENGGFAIDGEHIDWYRIKWLKSGLKLEMNGMRLTSKGRTCYSIVKDEFGFKGNKAKVYAQLEEYVEKLETALTLVK